MHTYYSLLVEHSIFLLALAYEWDIHKQSPKRQASFVEALQHFPVNDAASGLLLHYVSRSFPVYFLEHHVV